MEKRHEPDVHRYKLPGEWTVLVGKTEEDNDLLSLKVAKPNDLWFHIRGQSGSHVVLIAKSGEKPDRDTLKAVASIAAHHSKARNAGVVPVSCTEARNVTKPKGAKPGTVSIRKETILKVRPGLPGPTGTR